MEDSNQNIEPPVSKSAEAFKESKKGYLVECARADFFGDPRPDLFSRIKRKLKGAELDEFLENLTKQSDYISHLERLKSNPKLSGQMAIHSTPPIIKAIPGMPMRKMISLWENSVSALSDPKKNKLRFQARMVIDALHKEWERQSEISIETDDYFSWPTIEADLGDGSISTEAWLKEGMLQYMGYKVGSTAGKNVETRKRILFEIFQGVLPPVLPPKNMHEWHKPKTAQRLRKMAETIAAFIRNAKRRHDSRMELAIDEWEHDLDYLYSEFYVGKFHFAWPSAQTN